MTKIFFLFLFLLSISFARKAEAQEQVGYSVQTELPENQRDTGVSYFDLRVEPGQEQELNLILTNSGNEEITVQENIYDASTNQNGLIVYEAQEETDPSLEKPVSELVAFEEDE